MLRLLADENFNNDIVRGLVRVQDVGLSGTDDSTVLEWGAQEGWILLTKEVLDADIGRRLHFAEEARQKAGPSSLAASVAVSPGCPLLSSAIPSHQLGATKHVSLYRPSHASPRGDLVGKSYRRWQVESIQGEIVAMRLGGRTRAAVPGTTKIVAARGADLAWRQTFGQAIGGDRDIVQDPVGKGTALKVGIVGDESEALSSHGRIKPPQRRRVVLTIAGIEGRNVAAFDEGRASE